MTQDKGKGEMTLFEGGILPWIFKGGVLFIDADAFLFFSSSFLAPKDGIFCRFPQMLYKFSGDECFCDGGSLLPL